VLLGPSAAEVVAQYSDVVGRPAMMPYWTLGFHNCRCGVVAVMIMGMMMMMIMMMKRRRKRRRRRRRRRRARLHQRECISLVLLWFLTAVIAALSRWGYKSVWELEAVVANYTKAGIPLDVAWADIDYMDAYKVTTQQPLSAPMLQHKKSDNVTLVVVVVIIIIITSILRGSVSPSPPS
jgi:hypothetical protein